MGHVSDSLTIRVSCSVGPAGRDASECEARPSEVGPGLAAGLRWWASGTSVNDHVRSSVRSPGTGHAVGCTTAGPRRTCPNPVEEHLGRQLSVDHTALRPCSMASLSSCSYLATPSPHGFGDLVRGNGGFTRSRKARAISLYLIMFREHTPIIS